MSFSFDEARLANPDIHDNHQEWRRQLRRFIDKEIAPNFEQWDEQGYLPESLWPKAAEIGLLQLGFDEEFGGISEGIDIHHFMIINEELARVGSGGGIAAALMVHGIGLPPVAKFARAAVKEQIVPRVLAGEQRICLGITEPSGGSDVANIKTTAVRDGDYYIVNGSKTFISGAMSADWISTAVRTGGGGAGGVSMLAIDMNLPGVSRTSLDKKQGWWVAETATVYFDNVRVPATHMLGEEGQGFNVIMHNFNNERMAMIACMEACSRVCLEEAANWARERETFGKTMIKHQVIRHKLVAMKQRINATQGYMQVVARSINDGCANFGDIATLKVLASETMEFCAREASQILGGACYIRGNKVERIYREVRVNAIGGGSEEIMRDLAASQYGL